MSIYIFEKWRTNMKHSNIQTFSVLATVADFDISKGGGWRPPNFPVFRGRDSPPPISHVWSQLKLCSRFYLSFTVSQITTVYCIAEIQLISIFIFMTPSLYFQTECHKNMSCLEKSQTVGILKQVLSLETDHFGKWAVSLL